MPRSSAIRSRNISPCSRVGSSAATSTCTANPSGKITRGAVWTTIAVSVADGTGGGGVVLCCWAQAATNSASAKEIPRLAALARDDTLFLTLDLQLARDEIVFLRVVTERAKRHVQQLRGLRLHTAAALQRLQHEDLHDRVEVLLQ